jgi:hypothetical protein
MENVRSVSQNPQKFINYTKFPIAEVEELKPYESISASRDLKRRESKSQIKQQEKQQATTKQSKSVFFIARHEHKSVSV